MSDFWSGKHIEELETRLSSASDLKTRVDLLTELAWEIREKDTHRSRALAEEAYRSTSDKSGGDGPYRLGLAASLRCLAYLNNDAGNYDLSLSQSIRALEMLEQLSGEDPQAQSLMLDVLGSISWSYRSFGDYGVAAEYGMRAARIAHTRGNRLQEARVNNILGVIYAEMNDLDAALEMGRKVLALYREAGSITGECTALNNLAMTYLEKGEGEKALEYCQKGLHLALEHHSDSIVRSMMNTMGETYLGLKDFGRAEEYLLQALALSREQKASSDELLSQLNLGKIYTAQGNLEAAQGALQSALALSQAASDRSGAYKCYQALSEIYEKQGLYQQALEHHKRFHEIRESIFNENAARRLDGLKVVHQLETAQRDAEIHYLKTIELKREIEERKNAQASLERLAAIDPLTGLLNRREFYRLGEHEFEAAIEHERCLTAILVDLDHFKHINDSYGHAVGDQVLVQTASMVRESLRQGEIIGRYGGDELVILLPESSCPQGRQIAERLRERVMAEPVATPKGDLTITLSLGLAELRETRCATFEMLIECADQALYAAKQSGRNCVAVYPV